jgi:hypothetical protein
MPCHEGWNQGRCLFSANRMEQDIAVGTPELPLFAQIEAKGEFVTELTELIVEGIALDQGVTTAKHFPLRQVSVAREQPSILPEHTLYQNVVRNDLFISRVIAEDAEPARQAAKHGIGHEASDGFLDR